MRMVLNALPIKLSFSFWRCYKGVPIKFCNILLQYNPDSKTLVSMPITHESLSIQRAHTITLIIKNKTKGIRDSGKDEADTVYLLDK
ncbi:hypothetical protein ANAPH2_01321 [Anaplasma phagocytophilum]|nr:hypothetical protein ANAPH2_01321 [Anaplasma phagocytophilum]